MTKRAHSRRSTFYSLKVNPCNNPQCEQVKEKTRTITPIGAEGVPHVSMSTRDKNSQEKAEGRTAST